MLKRFLLVAATAFAVCDANEDTSYIQSVEGGEVLLLHSPEVRVEGRLTANGINIADVLEVCESGCQGMQQRVKDLEKQVQNLQGYFDNLTAVATGDEPVDKPGGTTCPGMPPDTLAYIRALEDRVRATKNVVDQIKPFNVFKSGEAGSYNLRTIFDDARTELNVDTHTYRCALMTSNQAHFKGKLFTVIANHYTTDTNPNFPHRIYDVVDLNAGDAGGCSGGLNSFDVTSTTGEFTFTPGNCYQAISLNCRGIFHVDPAPAQTEEDDVPDESCCGYVNRFAAAKASLTHVRSIVDQIKPFKVWETSVSGAWDLQDIFDAAQGDEGIDATRGDKGMGAHVWRCLLVSNNGAHGRGRLFTALTNHYTKSTHSGFPHRILDVTDLDHGASGGCSEGLTAFNLKGQTGYGSGGATFTFSPGDCKQTLRLDCRGPFVIVDEAPEEVPELEECGDDAVASTVAAIEAFKFSPASDTGTDGIVDKIKPFNVFPETKTAGAYDLRLIFDEARTDDGLMAHTYRCMLMTSNTAHFLGKLFTITANYYTEATHSGFPHKIYDVVDLDAGAAGGCSEGLTGWAVTSETGTFSFAPGNCQQSVRIDCRGLFHL